MNLGWWLQYVRICLDELNCMPVVKREDTLPKKKHGTCQEAFPKGNLSSNPSEKKTSQMVDGGFFLIDGKLKKTHQWKMFQGQLQWRSTCRNDNLPDPPVQIRYRKTPVGFNDANKHTGYSVHCTRSWWDGCFNIAIEFRMLCSNSGFA